jgi:hypothetical protein
VTYAENRLLQDGGLFQLPEPRTTYFTAQSCLLRSLVRSNTCCSFTCRDDWCQTTCSAEILRYITQSDLLLLVPPRRTLSLLVTPWWFFENTGCQSRDQQVVHDGTLWLESIASSYDVPESSIPTPSRVQNDLFPCTIPSVGSLFPE